MQFTAEQAGLLSLPLERRVFLHGPAGGGKTSAAAARLLTLLEAGVPGHSILVLVPQRTLAGPYREALLSAPGGSQAEILTAGGLAKRMCDLFWPLVAAEAGFAAPNRPPLFLTLETAQYYMAHLVRPLIEDNGLFESLAIDRNRLYSQILDNLNKAALSGFDPAEIETRLKAAWNGEASQLRVYADAQHCALLFRRYCLENNLLDFSLQVELFRRRLWPSLLVRAYLKDTYRHLIADNLEEDTPFAHDLIADWLPDFNSALLVCDADAGYRSYLSADRQGAFDLAGLCEEQVEFSALVCPPALEDLGQRLGAVLERPEARPSEASGLPAELTIASRYRFFPEMLDGTANAVSDLLAAGVPPGEIAVLAPLLPDSLRFALTGRFDRLGIPYRSHRPSRALGDEPPARCLLTLAQLAHPAWGIKPSRFEVAYAVLQAIAGLDLVRAQLIAEIAYRTRDGIPVLEPLDRLKPEMQERITYTFGLRYEELRAWLHAYTQEEPAELDFFLSRLFGEVLSQPGFGFHADLTAGQTAANLIESAGKFRRAVDEAGGGLPDLGRAYSELVRDGVIAAQYVESWQTPAADAVFIAPAYTFLMNNRPLAHQFWLDAGSDAWFQRLYQPLTHPYVLSQRWAEGRLWTAAEEYETNRETLYRLVLGLLRRCTAQVHLAWCDLNEGGSEQRGMLLKAIYQLQLQAGGTGG